MPVAGKKAGYCSESRFRLLLNTPLYSASARIEALGCRIHSVYLSTHFVFHRLTETTCLSVLAAKNIDYILDSFNNAHVSYSLLPSPLPPRGSMLQEFNSILWEDLRLGYSFIAMLKAHRHYPDRVNFCLNTISVNLPSSYSILGE